ncbi:hypothetical protein LP090_05765 [Moraxella bovis]|uniref:hypothetical protein n=1 Tax=Moraxella bovis TaxID=476 RepID=UPI002227C2BC|nr:hypothetical protein [Moraxella bovis]UYZ67511.1 hypothetical protein LP122_06830 [Moraxella bovis]UYZ69872.1 hypothetical protein LP089_06880 [Moraxella bovis]UYZ74207.1 hypothetical protein LP105_05790 [Moraxella bovis]UZA13155.1 hypothetical protein LP102_06845 [Moraxella bovis]UZA28506.1 hypothetical protein LP119_06010 [Moraxella bovis]
MHKKLSLIIFFALLLSACDDEYRRGYSDGKSDGYKEGHQVGYTEGHDVGYWEGTQFLVQDNALPTAGLGILIALCFVVIGLFYSLFYKGWVYFFKEKWVRYSTLTELKKIKKSSVFKANMENKIKAEKVAKLKEEEIRYSISMLQLDEKISDIIINSHPKYDENSDINNLYIDIFKETVKSKELSNKHKIDIYSEILNRAKNLSADDNVELS